MLATWLLAFIMAASIGIGIAFLICSLILNASNNKGDSRSKVEDYSSDIISYYNENRISHNQTAFVHTVETNIEYMCQSKDYKHRYKTSLPFGSKEPVCRYIPKTVRRSSLSDDAEIEGSSVDDTEANFDPVIYTGDILTVAGFRNAMHGLRSGLQLGGIGLGSGIETGKYGTFRTLSGVSMTAEAYNATSGAVLRRPPVSAAKSFAERQQAPAPSDIPAAASEPEPIYEAPTATRPLWEDASKNDDFSDFQDFM